MTTGGAGLGAFLRACRARSDPARLGLPSTGHRRVKGMRREEVAALAGVSVDYYTRLEQSREASPSLQVVDALARVFELDRDARQHAYRLAGLMPVLDLPPAPTRPRPSCSSCWTPGPTRRRCCSTGPTT